MKAHRAFYVTQESLSVWVDGATDPDQSVVFADSDEGLEQFDAYLAENAELTSFVIVDVIEEEFAIDTIPKIGMRDRSALIQRRLQRRFPRSPYRLAVYQGKQKRSSDEAIAVHSAVSNHELLDPWLQIILRHETPLTGIFSVPLMAANVVKQFYKKSHPVLFLTQHQQQKLRQVFMQKGQVQSARLSQSPAIGDAEYAEFVVTEIQRSRRYLERSRLLSSIEQLDVCMIADSDLAEKILDCAQSNSPLQFHFVDPELAAARVGIESPLRQGRMESLYLAAAYRNRPKHSYAVSGESRFWHMRRLRHAIIGTAIAASAICSLFASLFLSDAWFLRNQSRQIEDQVTRLTETFRRENERFDPIKADSHEMKLAVDTGDYILSNRLPVPWVMQQVGLVMGDYPDVQILTLGWTAEAAAPSVNAPRQRTGEQMPVQVPAISAVSAEITAKIVPFDGNMRRAFTRIDQLVADLSAHTAFSQVVAVEYPLDASPHSSISGEILAKAQAETANFRLRLRLPVQIQGAANSEVADEPV